MTRNSCRLGGKILPLILAFVITISGMQTRAASDPAVEAGFIPHKALYEIRLSSKKSSATVSNISGRMLYEWYSACDGWVSNHQFNMLYEYIEIPAVNITSDFSTYESFDGKSFNFTAQRKKEGDLFEEFRGASAISEEKKYPDKIMYTIPKSMKLDIPQGTLFPTTHTLAVLKNIKEGRHFFKATIFDGSDAEGAVDVNTFIGKEFIYHLPEKREDRQEPQQAEYIDPALVNTKAWNLRLAFFPLNTSDVTADYEMSLVFHENGVISHMEIDYEDFSVNQELVAVEPIESECDVMPETKK